MVSAATKLSLFLFFFAITYNKTQQKNHPKTKKGTTRLKMSGSLFG